jgi:hypothetical protein
MSDNKMCTYCAKWFPVNHMRQLPKMEYNNYYCPDCYPEVIEEYWKLPWNRNAE